MSKICPANSLCYRCPSKLKECRDEQGHERFMCEKRGWLRKARYDCDFAPAAIKLHAPRG